MKKFFKKYFTKEHIKDWSLVTLGNLLVAFSFSFFLDPNNLVIGGTTGLATILRELFSIDPSITALVINTALLIVGLFLLGKEFFIKTVYSTLVFPVMIKLLNLLYNLITPEGEVLISDPMLVILFSSLILGIGIGLVLRQGGTTGGTEVGQKILFKYMHIPFSVSLFLIDGVIILLGALLIKEEGQFMDFHMVLYAVIFAYISGLVMDQIVFSGFNSRAVNIISDKNEEIKQRILNDFERGVTEIKVVGGYTNNDKTKLVCLLSSNEFYKLKGIIHEIDPNAFFYVVRASEVSGEGFTRK